jgi:hypothetical protein
MKKIFTAIAAMLMALSFTMQAQVKQGYIPDKASNAQAELRQFSAENLSGDLIPSTIDPVIAGMVSEINADTIRKTLVELGNWGSRFLMNDNKKEIAISLLDKFRSYGYTDVRLDSFYLIVSWQGMTDSSWQYNVVCTQRGSSAPDEVYVIGGHWDSICLPDPVNDAPGVNDNGTAVAATLEIARIMRKHNYQPEATIRFTLFAAEELGLFGSAYDAQKAYMTGEDIRYMLNLDMISNNPENLSQVKIFHYVTKEWAGALASDVTERYTDLQVMVPAVNVASSSDSYPYWYFNFPVAYFEEIAFSPNWHKPSDTLGNCNVPYLTKITGAALAILAEQQKLPYPQDLTAKSTTASILLSWKATANDQVAGYNVYRADLEEGAYLKINISPVNDSIYSDMTSGPNEQHWYMITTVNQAGEESMFSNRVTGVRFSFSDSLLVLANVKGNNTTPDSIRNFYSAVLDTIPYRWMDINASHKATLADFSKYRTILWMSNSLEYENITQELYTGLQEFSANGGNILFAGFNPARFLMNTNNPVPFKVPEWPLLRTVFHVDSIDRKAQSMMCGAYTVKDDYPPLSVDTLKYMDKNYKGNIYMIDIVVPDSLSHVIYRFDSHFDSTGALGKMKHKPVGIEYMGEDFRSILLSFPLWYIDTSEARQLMKYVMTQKFAHTVGQPEQPGLPSSQLRIFPNPAAEFAKISCKAESSDYLKLTARDLSGKILESIIIDRPDEGWNTFILKTSGWKSGIYIISVASDQGVLTGKLIKMASDN